MGYPPAHSVSYVVRRTSPCSRRWRRPVRESSGSLGMAFVAGPESTVAVQPQHGVPDGRSSAPPSFAGLDTFVGAAHSDAPHAELPAQKSAGADVVRTQAVGLEATAAIGVVSRRVTGDHKLQFPAVVCCHITQPHCGNARPAEQVPRGSRRQSSSLMEACPLHSRWSNGEEPTTRPTVTRLQTCACD